MTGADFTGSTITGVVWTGATCPDGTAANAHGATCVGHLTPLIGSMSPAGNGALAQIAKPGSLDAKLVDQTWGMI